MRFDLERFRLENADQLLAAARRRFPSARRMKGRFVRPVPLSWVRTASQLGGAALPVAILLAWQAGVHRRTTGLAVPSLALAEFHLSRQAYYRALLALERAGLITVDRRPGRKARATLVQWDQAAKAQETP
jgi:hypothetical protein